MWPLRPGIPVSPVWGGTTKGLSWCKKEADSIGRKLAPIRLQVTPTAAAELPCTTAVGATLTSCGVLRAKGQPAAWDGSNRMPNQRRHHFLTPPLGRMVNIPHWIGLQHPGRPEPGLGVPGGNRPTSGLSVQPQCHFHASTEASQQVWQFGVHPPRHPVNLLLSLPACNCIRLILPTSHTASATRTMPSAPHARQPTPLQTHGNQAHASRNAPPASHHMNEQLARSPSRSSSPANPCNTTGLLFQCHRCGTLRTQISATRPGSGCDNTTAHVHSAQGNTATHLTSNVRGHASGVPYM